MEWRQKSRYSRAVRFIETYCIVPKGYGAGKPMRLAKFQKRWLRKALAAGIRAAVLQLPRGNGKSTFLAAIAVWAVFDPRHGDAPQVAVVGVTVGQAIRNVYGVAAAMVDMNPELANRSIQFTAIGATRLFVPSTRGEMFPIASQPDTLQGLDPSVAINDELGFTSQETWDALLLASGKRPNSLIVGIGTPGVDRDNALWNLRQLVIEGRPLPGMTFTEYAAPDTAEVRDEKAWRVANPALDEGFMDIDALRMAVESSPAVSFRIFRMGLWAEGQDSWLGDDGPAVWDSLAEPLDFDAGVPIWVGVDAALTRDTTAVCWIGLRPDGRMHAKVRIWVPAKDEPVDLFEVMGHLRDLAIKYRVGAVSYDPRFMDWPARVLADEGLPVVELPQSIERMTGICGDLYTVIRERQITHDGDPLFRSHVMNAVTRMNDRGWTLSKNKSRGHIDACIALGLAVDRVRNKKKPRSPVVVL